MGIITIVWWFTWKKYYKAFIKMFKYGCFAPSNGKNWEVLCKTLIFGSFLGQSMGIWPPGWAQIWSTGTVFLFISSVKCSSLFQMVFYGYSTYFKGWKLRKTVFSGFFRQNLGVRPPVVLRERVISWVFCTFCRWCNTYFKNNLHLSWFFIIRLVKM